MKVLPEPWALFPDSNRRVSVIGLGYQLLPVHSLAWLSHAQEGDNDISFADTY